MGSSITSGGITVNQFAALYEQAKTEGLISGGGGGGGLGVPDFVVTGSSSYTIPAGFWGYVSASVSNGQVFTVDGVSVLESSNISTSRVHASTQFGWNLSQDNTTNSNNYYLPSGTTISGGRYVAQIYAEA